MRNHLKICLILVALAVLISLAACTEEEAVSDTENTSATLIQTESETEEITTEEPIVEKILEITLAEGETCDFEALAAKIRENPDLLRIVSPYSTLSAEEYNSLSSINPAVDIITSVQVQDKVLDLSQSEIDISKTRIRDKASFDALLANVPNGIKFIMCDCGYSNEEMAALREKYPQLSFAWRIYMGKWNLRTDDEAFSVMIYTYDYERMTSKDIEVLKYCTNMKALDLGHQAISDLTVLGQLTELRVLILADNHISNVAPLANLKKLQYLELFVNRISDLSPLAACTELVDLNFGWNTVRDISALYTLEKIERLWLPTTPITKDKREEISANFPNAAIVFADKDSISSGWREHERYFSMRGMFTNNRYDENFVSQTTDPLN